MIGITETDGDMVRFLWFEDPNNLNSEIVQLRFMRFVFGLRPSPAILASTIRHHLDAHVSEEFKLDFIELLKNSLYVDDLVTGKDSQADALELCKKSKSIMQQGGFNLRKWRMNSRTVQEAINRSNDTVEPAVTTDGEKFISEEDESYAKTTTGPPTSANSTADNATVKVLGSIWNTATDQFKFDFTELSEQAKLLPTTRRSLLKVSAKIFDPLGLLSPFTIL